MNDIEAIKSRLDLVEVVKHYVPDLKRAGRSYKANCPFHQEKTPSFVVTPDLQIFKCFGCGEGGDVISFIQKIERLDFGEALQTAAEKAGYELTSRGNAKDDELKRQRQRVLEANALTAKFWNYILKTHAAGRAGREYLKQRQIRGEEVDSFSIGYAPPGDQLKRFLLSKGYLERDLIEWGLLVDRDGRTADKFRDRLILPITDTKGNIIGFSGRIVTPNDRAPKYLNSPETPVYHKADIVMGISQAQEAARKSGFMILEEGNIDLLSSHKAGIKNICATGGTALTEKQCILIKRYADVIYFAFDSDAAGQKALLRGLELAERLGIRHKSIDLGTYQDPDDMISANPELWREAVAAPINTVEFLLRSYQADLDLGTADGKQVFVDRMYPVLRMLKDRVQLEHFAAQTALAVGTTADVILEQIGNPRSSTPPMESVSGSIHRTEDHQPTIAVRSNNREVYLLSLLYQQGQAQQDDIELFADINCRGLAVKLFPGGSPVPAVRLAELEITDGEMEALQEVLSIDLSSVIDISAETRRTIEAVRHRRLREQILELRKVLKTDPENDEALSKLSAITRQLRGA